MPESLFLLAAAAATVGALHTLAPDHWVPFAALARARGWSAARTARVTAACGLGHVTTSVILALVGLWLGLGVLKAFGERLESIAGVLLIVFGLAYAAWGLRRKAGVHVHGHTHVHYDHLHDADRTSAWALFLLFSADPCVAVIPLVGVAAPRGALAVAAVAVAYEVATLATMVALVLPAREGAKHLHARWIDTRGDVVAGGVIAAVGVVVAILGI